MSDQLDELHARAGLDLLHADAGLVVVDGSAIPPAQVRRYVRVYTSIERPAGAPGNKLSGESNTWTVRWYCHCVGENDTAARAIAMRVRVALLDVRPSIPGRSCGMIRQDADRPPDRDETSGVLVVDLVQVYRLTTTG